MHGPRLEHFSMPPKRIFSRPPKSGQIRSATGLKIRPCPANESRMQCLRSLVDGFENPPFDLVRESLSSTCAQFFIGFVRISSVNWEYRFTLNTLWCFFDLPFSIVALCLGVGETLLKDIKKTLYAPRWPCSDIYRNGLPVSPEFIFGLRRRYMDWLQLPKFGGANARLFYAMQLAENASIAHQRLLPTGSLKCDLAKRMEDEARASRMAAAAVEAVAETVEAESLPDSPSGPADVVVPIPASALPVPFVVNFPDEEEDPPVDQHRGHEEGNFYFVDECEDGTNVTNVATGEDYGDLYNSLFSES